MRAAGVMVLASILLSASAAEASAATEVRFLHAVPGGPEAELRLTGAEPSAPVGFGEATDYVSSSAGSVKATVVSGGKPLDGAVDIPSEGRHTLVFRSSGGKIMSTLLTDGKAAASRARFRVVHAAPEIDEAEFVVGDKAVGRLKAGKSSDYETVEPGSYTLAARRPGESDALVESPEVNLVAGAAETAYLVGSGGEQTRFVVLEDAASAPDEAPATGLGGLRSDGEPAWLLALLAALAAGTAGGVAYARATRG